MKTAAILIIAIFAQAAGNVFLTRGMKSVATTAPADGGLMSVVSQSLHVALQAMQSPEIWAGTLLLIVFFALYSAALSWADLSFVLPATAFGYVLNVAAGHYFLNEEVTRARWIGSIIITLGVVCVSRSGERTATIEPAQASAAGEGQ
ncbi:MAG TPA: EamA family transporter [Blastocatellia bacterium]|nr:EamA family transporter [Blastocatellia bacterium]